MIFGAIDIGSNAARVLIMSVEQKESKLMFTKQKLLRYPLRLGLDAFTTGEVSEYRRNKLIKMCQVFKLLMELYEVEDYLVYATSAMRTVSNGEQLVEQVLHETGMYIQIIDGLQEANLLIETKIAENIRPDRNYLYVDVGGGSSELVLIRANRTSLSKSFPIGTIRILEQQVDESHFDQITNWVNRNTKEDEEYFGIGSGGNINTIFGLTGLRMKEPMTITQLKGIQAELNPFSKEELMEQYGFKEDRSEVIKPALRIYDTAFSAAHVNQIFVPKIGLVDGMIHRIATKYFS